MTDARRLATLNTLARLVRDRDMAQLERLAAAQTQTRSKIEQMSRPMPLVEDPALFSARQAHLHWAKAQKMQLNMALAKETAQMMEQRKKTARSFGRAVAFVKLSARAKQVPG